MIVNPKLTALVPTVDPIQAKQFYMETLGLILESEDAYGMEFKGAKASLRVTVVQELTPQPFAVLGFKVDKILSQVKTLAEKGVQFERYDAMHQDEWGIWISPSGARVAWFKDPDGNLLSLTQLP